MGVYKNKLNMKSSTYTLKSKYNINFFTHDLLVFLSYLLNNFLFHCYNHIIYKTFSLGVNCLSYFYHGNFVFLTRCLESTVSYFIVYTWLKRYSGNFDGYAFHHIFYYRYGMINFREMVSRVFGTLGSSALFGYLYYKTFNLNRNSYNSSLQKTLYNMLDSKGFLTILETIFSNFNKNKRHLFLKKFISGLLFLPSFKYEDKYFDLVEKYLAILFECFVVELTFSLFIYMLTYLILNSKNSPKANLAISTFVRSVFVTCGNMYLSKVDGIITLDESKSLFLYFGEGNILFLFVRLLANLLGAFLVPRLLPMPNIMSLYEYKEMYPNSQIETKAYKSEFSYSYYIESDTINRRKKANNSKWPNTKLGKSFSKFEDYLYNKFKKEIK